MLNFRLALRSLSRNRLFTIVAMASLSLGIGLTTAVFSMFDRMVLRPLPVPNPEQLVNLSAPGPKPGSQATNNAGNVDQVFSYPMFRNLEQLQTPFTGIAAHRLFRANLGFGDQTVSAAGTFVSGSYFSVLGLQPALGRLLGPNDDRTVGAHFVAVLSFDCWQTRFDKAAEVIGSTLTVNGQPMTIVGVAPRGFYGTTLGSRPQVFAPITMRKVLESGWRDRFEERRSYWVYLFARLRPGVTLEQARTAINVPYRAIVNEVEVPLQRGVSDTTMAQFKAKEISVEDGRRGQSSLHSRGRTPLLLLLAVTGLMLLSACANTANLLLARGAARASEMAVRCSIGGSRRQIVMQLLVESLLLAAGGGIAGLLVARWTLAFMASLLPSHEAAVIQVGLDSTMFGFAALLTLATAVLFGLFPAVNATRPDLVLTLKGGVGHRTTSRSAASLRKFLVTAQIGMSMTLLMLAGLLIGSLSNLMRVDLGIETQRLLTFRLSPVLNGYEAEQSRALFERVENELRALPGVTGVTASLVPLIAGSRWGHNVRVEGFEAGPNSDTFAGFNEIGPGYFRVMGIQVLAGREFTAADGAGRPKVAIVNEAFARKFMLGRNPVGKRMRGGRGTGELDTEIIGLVRDTNYSAVKEVPPPLYYCPYRQSDNLGPLSFYLRTALPEDQLLRTVGNVIRRFDPALPIEGAKSMATQVGENIYVERLVGVLSATLAGLATLLAAIGLYGVLAYTVALRTREIGLRMALGADTARIRAMVIGDVGRMTAIGALAGLAAAGALSRLGRSLLFELEAHDPKVLVTSALILTLVALGAGELPARRASRIEPIRALRRE